jgi:3-hydroxyacyl-CoA dehydrogenase
MNTIGGDTIQMLHAGVAEAERNFLALVVGNEAVNFSAGANVMLLLLEAQEGNWDEVDLMVRAFQGATSALRYAKVPVVVAPVGLTLGGGCEIVLHADRVQAAAESYIGLVEVGVGLIRPAGGRRRCSRARSRVFHRTPICCLRCSGYSRRSASRKWAPALTTRGRSATCATSIV